MNKLETQGKCPCCGSECLTYGQIGVTDGGIYYPWICDDCKATGEEHYFVDFDSHHNVKSKAERRNK